MSHGSAEPTEVFALSRRSSAFALLAAAGFIAVSAVAGLFQARRLLRRDRTALVLDAVGFVDRASLSGVGRVAWYETVGMRIVDHPERTLVVEVVDPDAVAARQPSAAGRQAARASTRMFGSPVCIPLTAVGRREGDLLEAFERLGHLLPGFYRGTPSST
ncbi:STM3941 family protein [Isoptericola sp. NPDC060257]|uniref:STM3941 family protein n=1 Tax=Isoptericola sp. NPDC060257 TaxID=3347087 RepID=UPI00365321FA